MKQEAAQDSSCLRSEVAFNFHIEIVESCSFHPQSMLKQVDQESAVLGDPCDFALHRQFWEFCYCDLFSQSRAVQSMPHEQRTNKVICTGLRRTVTDWTIPDDDEYSELSLADKWSVNLTFNFIVWLLREEPYYCCIVIDYFKSFWIFTNAQQWEYYLTTLPCSQSGIDLTVGPLEREILAGPGPEEVTILILLLLLLVLLLTVKWRFFELRPRPNSKVSTLLSESGNSPPESSSIGTSLKLNLFW